MENNTLGFLVNLNIDDLKAKADEGKRRFEELGKRAEQEGHKIDDIFKSLGAGTDFEDRLSALRNEMETCEDKIVISLKNIKKWEEDAKRAFAAGDFGAWNDSNKDIVDAQKNVAGLSARLEYLRTLYDTLRKSAGETFADPTRASRLFISEEEYNQVKQMEEELENLKQKKAELADDDDLNGDERTKQLVAINAQIIELQQQLAAANQQATDAASALGDNLGSKAAESSTRLYELNAALDEQQKTYDNLVAKLEDVAQEMDAATKAGDTSTLKDLQLEYQHLAEQVQNANNALQQTKGEQRDAAENWEGMLDTISSLSDEVQQSTRPVGQAITSFTQLSAAFKNSKNPVQTFRATLQALRGGMSLTQISVKGVISGLKALWKALLSNPITAILVAITALVAAFVSIANSIKSVAETQARLNAAENVHLDLLKQITENSDRGYDQAIRAKERELKILKAGNSSLSAQYKLEDEILRLKKEKAEKAKELWQEEAVKIDQTTKSLERQQKALAALELRSSDGGDLTWKQVNRRMAEQGMNVEYRRSGFLGWGGSFGSYVSAAGTDYTIHFDAQIAATSTIIAIISICIATYIYKGETQPIADRLYKTFPKLHRAAYKRFYQDEIWQYVTHRIIFRCVSTPIAWFDRHVVDGTFNFMAWGANEAGESIRSWQSGDVRQYAVWFLTGTVALTLVLLALM